MGRFQRRPFVHRNMFGLCAFDLVLRIIIAAAMHVSFVVHIVGVILKITPLTTPASEFQLTWSPILNRCMITNLRKFARVGPPG